MRFDLTFLSSIDKDPNSDIYWDAGPRGITNFTEEHNEACGDNYLCNLLRLAEVEVKSDAEEDELESNEDHESGGDENTEAAAPKKDRAGPLCHVCTLVPLDALCST